MSLSVSTLLTESLLALLMHRVDERLIAFKDSLVVSDAIEASLRGDHCFEKFPKGSLSFHDMKLGQQTR